MTDDNPSIEGITPPPISDAEHRLMISAELGTIRDMLRLDAFSPEGLQRVHQRLRLLAVAISPADAQMWPLREVTLSELRAKLVVATGFPLDYWEYQHAFDVPDDPGDLA
ncbi:MAG: hypothetical protein M3O28_10930 [Actinomycetota bacterium]|nr:hypothetical protein [Actinomycetota bacterium]